MRNILTGPCKRPGCRFQRAVLAAKDGRFRRQQHCSPSCRVWLARAKRAGEEKDGKAAAELMRLVALLDARQSSTEKVEEVFSTPAPQR